MLASQRSLTAAQLSRNTLTEVTESATPLREATLETFRRRNAALDTLFYDVGKVTPVEARGISPWLAREGSLLIVPPTGQGDLILCKTIGDFAELGGWSIRILAVAGVGSSALGSAAFARNVADAFGEPVAAVVSGYGLADLVTEAAGGWFWFGGLNSLRHSLETLDIRSRTTSLAGASISTDAAISLERLSLDTKTVSALLADDRFNFSLLTGHSKGNLVLSEALFALETGSAALRHTVREDVWIVKISAAVTIPRRYTRVIDVMGNIDWFGALNSRPLMSIEKIWPFAWHHTNTELPFELPVTSVFRELIDEQDIVL